MSTLMNPRTAPLGSCLPAATSAPAALVIAVEDRVSQETSALAQAVGGTGSSTSPTAAHAAASLAAAIAPFARRNDVDVMGSPPRGTPV